MNLATTKSDLPQQMEDLKRIIGIFDKINKLSNDLIWANAVTDELFICQPFLLSMLMGYKYDLSTIELDETLNLYFAVWEYFKIDPKVKLNAITKDRFEHFQNTNIQIFAINDPASRETVTILLAAIFERFKNRPVLLNMETQIKGAIMIGVKSIIECFEEISS